jgi:hypothetical protein
VFNLIVHLVSVICAVGTYNKYRVNKKPETQFLSNNSFYFYNVMTTAGMTNKSFISVLIALLTGTIAIFQSPEVFSQQDMPDSLVNLRIQHIQKILTRDNSGTRNWWYGWLTGYSAATAGQCAIGAFSETKKIRQDMFLGAITTTLGAIGQFTTPVVPDHKADSLSRLPEGNTRERIFKLKRAEEFLKEAAMRESEARSWKVHATCGLVSVGSGLVTWLAFKRTPLDGLINFAINMSVSEIQIWSLPSKAMKNYKDYCRNYKLIEKSHASAPEPKLNVNVYPGIVQVVLMF